jgi:hypothetical protein
MILLIDEELFASNSVRDVDRIALLNLAAVREHSVLWSGRPQAKTSAASSPTVESWRNGLKDRIAREVKVILDSIRLAASTLAYDAERVLVSNRWQVRGLCILELEVALRMLSEPLHVLVENGVRDGAFLRRVLPPEWREQLEQWERRGRVRFEHAGGVSELRMIVEHMSDDANANLTWGMPAAAWKATHFLISDHDGTCLEQPGLDAKRFERTCRDAGLSRRYHVLRRRKQEHYLPKEVMQWIVEREITNPTEKRDLMMKIEEFFAGDRSFGDLPKPGETDKLWKGRFWRHRKDEWTAEWFDKDKCWPEMRGLAEAIQRAL